MSMPSHDTPKHHNTAGIGERRQNRPKSYANQDDNSGLSLARYDDADRPFEINAMQNLIDPMIHPNLSVDERSAANGPMNEGTNISTNEDKQWDTNHNSLGSTNYVNEFNGSLNDQNYMFMHEHAMHGSREECQRNKNAHYEDTSSSPNHEDKHDNYFGSSESDDGEEDHLDVFEIARASQDLWNRLNISLNTDEGSTSPQTPQQQHHTLENPTNMISHNAPNCNNNSIIDSLEMSVVDSTSSVENVPPSPQQQLKTAFTPAKQSSSQRNVDTKHSQSSPSIAKHNQQLATTNADTADSNAKPRATASSAASSSLSPRKVSSKSIAMSTPYSTTNKPERIFSPFSIQARRLAYHQDEISKSPLKMAKSHSNGDNVNATNQLGVDDKNCATVNQRNHLPQLSFGLQNCRKVSVILKVSPHPRMLGKVSGGGTEEKGSKFMTPQPRRRSMAFVSNTASRTSISHRSRQSSIRKIGGHEDEGVVYEEEDRVDDDGYGPILFPLLLEKAEDGNATDVVDELLGKSQVKVGQVQRSHSHLQHGEVALVNPNAFQPDEDDVSQVNRGGSSVKFIDDKHRQTKRIVGRVTVETARLVAEVSQISSEDWARKYRFDDVIWPNYSSLQSGMEAEINNEKKGIDTMSALARAAVYDAMSHQRRIVMNNDHNESESVINCYDGEFSTVICAVGGSCSGKTQTVFGSSVAGCISSAVMMNGPAVEGNKICRDHDLGLLGEIASEILSPLQKIGTSESAHNNVGSFSLSILEIVDDDVLRDVIGSVDDGLDEHGGSTNLRIQHSMDKRGAVVLNLKQVSISSMEQLQAILSRSFKSKALRKAWAKDGGHGHFITTITIPELCYHAETAMHDGSPQIFAHSIQLVDLASADRHTMDSASLYDNGGDAWEKSRDRRVSSIRKSLSALRGIFRGLIIQEDAPSSSQQSLSYRECTLTQLLQRSLQDQSRTVVVGTVCPSSKSYNQTLATMDFMTRLLKRPGDTAHGPFVSSDKTHLAKRSSFSHNALSNLLRSASHGSRDEDEHESEGDDHGDKAVDNNSLNETQSLHRALSTISRQSSIASKSSAPDGMFLKSFVSDPRQRLAKLLNTAPLRKKSTGVSDELNHRMSTPVSSSAQSDEQMIQNFRQRYDSVFEQLDNLMYDTVEDDIDRNNYGSEIIHALTSEDTVCLQEDQPQGGGMVIDDQLEKSSDVGLGCSLGIYTDVSPGIELPPDVSTLQVSVDHHMPNQQSNNKSMHLKSFINADYEGGTRAPWSPTHIGERNVCGEYEATDQHFELQRSIESQEDCGVTSEQPLLLKEIEVRQTSKINTGESPRNSFSHSYTTHDVDELHFQFSKITNPKYPPSPLSERATDDHTPQPSVHNISIIDAGNGNSMTDPLRVDVVDTTNAMYDGIDLITPPVINEDNTSLQMDNRSSLSASSVRNPNIIMSDQTYFRQPQNSSFRGPLFTEIVPSQHIKHTAPIDPTFLPDTQESHGILEMKNHVALHTEINGNEDSFTSKKSDFQSETSDGDVSSYSAGPYDNHIEPSNGEEEVVTFEQDKQSVSLDSSTSDEEVSIPDESIQELGNTPFPGTKSILSDDLSSLCSDSSSDEPNLTKINARNVFVQKAISNPLRVFMSQDSLDSELLVSCRNNPSAALNKKSKTCTNTAADHIINLGHVCIQKSDSFVSSPDLKRMVESFQRDVDALMFDDESSQPSAKSIHENQSEVPTNHSIQVHEMQRLPVPDENAVCVSRGLQETNHIQKDDQSKLPMVGLSSFDSNEAMAVSKLQTQNLIESEHTNKEPVQRNLSSFKSMHMTHDTLEREGIDNSHGANHFASREVVKINDVSIDALKNEVANLKSKVNSFDEGKIATDSYFQRLGSILRGDCDGINANADACTDSIVGSGVTFEHIIDAIQQRELLLNTTQIELESSNTEKIELTREIHYVRHEIESTLLAKSLAEENLNKAEERIATQAQSLADLESDLDRLKEQLVKVRSENTDASFFFCKLASILHVDGDKQMHNSEGNLPIDFIPTEKQQQMYLKGIDNLQERLQQAFEENRTLARCLESRLKESKVEEMQNQIEQLKQSAHQEETIRIAAEKVADEAMSMNKALTQEITILKEDLLETKNLNRTLQNANKDLLESKESISAEYHTIKDAMKQRGYELSKLNASLNTCDEERIQLKQQLASVSERASSEMKHRVGNLKTEYRKRLETFKKTISMQQGKIVEMEHQIATKSETDNSTNLEMSHLRAKLAQSNEENASARRRFEQFEKSSSLKLRNSEDRLSEFQRELNAANKEVTSQKEENVLLQNEIHHLREIMDIAHESVGELNSLREENERLKDIVNHYEHRFNQDFTAEVPTEIRGKRSGDNNYSFHEDDSFINERVTALMRENEQNNITLRTLQGENITLKSSVEDCHGTIKLMRAELNDLQMAAGDGGSKVRKKDAFSVENRGQDRYATSVMETRLDNASSAVHSLRSSRGRVSSMRNVRGERVAIPYEVSSSRGREWNTPQERRGVNRSEVGGSPYEINRRMISPTSLSAGTSWNERSHLGELSAEKELRYKAEEICAGVLASAKTGFEKRDSEIKLLRQKLFKLTNGKPR